MSNIKQEHDHMPFTQVGQTGDPQHMVITPDQTEVKPPMVDTGILCWLQVVGSFAMWSNSWGVINSFGAISIIHIPITSAC